MIALMLLLAAADTAANTKILIEPMVQSPLSESDTKKLEAAAQKTVLPDTLRKRLTLTTKATGAAYSLRITLQKTNDAYTLSASVVSTAKTVTTFTTPSDDPARDVSSVVIQVLTKAFGESTPQLMFEREVKTNVHVEEQRGRRIGVVIGTDPNNALAELLRTVFGFTVSTLLDAQATRDNTVKRFKWLAEQAKPNDQVLIILAGASFDVTNDDIAAIPARRLVLGSKQAGFAERLERVMQEDQQQRVDPAQWAAALERAGIKTWVLPTNAPPFLLDRTR